MGHDWGLSGGTPFGVKGNRPDFKDVGEDDGIVKYELVGLKDVTKDKEYESDGPLITENDESKVLGTMLVEVVDKDVIKVEIFPGKTADQINGFTSGALMYER